MTKLFSVVHSPRNIPGFGCSFCQQLSGGSTRLRNDSQLDRMEPLPPATDVQTSTQRACSITTFLASSLKSSATSIGEEFYACLLRGLGAISVTTPLAVNLQKCIWRKTAFGSFSCIVLISAWNPASGQPAMHHL